MSRLYTLKFNKIQKIITPLEVKLLLDTDDVAPEDIANDFLYGAEEYSVNYAHILESSAARNSSPDSSVMYEVDNVAEDQSVSEVLDSVEYKDFLIQVVICDITKDNPRECDYNLGAMICFHCRYNLGDKTDLRSDSFNSWTDLDIYLTKRKHAFITLPIYMYDHSGITIATSPFLCKFDSGQIGYIYATKLAIKSYFKLPRNRVISKDRHNDAIDKLRQEVRDYDKYLSNDYTYSYMIFDNTVDAQLLLAEGEDFNTVAGAIDAAKYRIDKGIESWTKIK